MAFTLGLEGSVIFIDGEGEVYSVVGRCGERAGINGYKKSY